MGKQTVLITGATSGIGASLFEQYVSSSNNVIACGRSQDKLQKLSTQAFMTCCFDVNDRQQVETAAQGVNERLDILILNAGDCRYIDDAKHFDGQLFADIINTNLVSVGLLLEYFLPKVNPGGQVIFISSSATILPFPRSEAYGASKAGLDYLANSLRLDLYKENIEVTLVHPGFIKTPLTDKNDFNMPFMISSEQAAERIITGIKKRELYLHFPKRLTLLLKLFSFFPTKLWQKMIVKDKH